MTFPAHHGHEQWRIYYHVEGGRCVHFPRCKARAFSPDAFAGYGQVVSWHETAPLVQPRHIASMPKSTGIRRRSKRGAA